MTLKPNLEFNWVMFLIFNFQAVISNNKFRSFLVRILIRKDNADNKVFLKGILYKRKKKEKDRKDKMLQIFVQFAGINLRERERERERECRGNKFL